MLKIIYKNGNIIYGDLSKQVDLRIDFKGRNNIVFFAGSSSNINATFHGDNSLIFHGGGGWSNGHFDMRHNTLCYIGRESTFNGTTLGGHEAQNIIIGDDCMFSWGIWMSPSDHHLIFDNTTYKRINFAKGIIIGDHVWVGQESAILKGSFVASGAILGARSTNAGRAKYSNAIYVGNPSVCVKKGVFFDRADPSNGEWSKQKIDELSFMPKDDFKFTFEKDKFLNPILLDKQLKGLETAEQKLEFVYDYIYNNTYKNRFALFEDSDTTGCELYKDTSKTPFSKLKFELIDKSDNCE